MLKLKLQPTETARVLHSALGCSTFTVEELAERSSVKVATVRTVLFRSRSLLEAVEDVRPAAGTKANRAGVLRAFRAGRPSKRYRLSAHARETLSIQLAHLTSEARSDGQLDDTGAAVEMALSAAESSLELKSDPDSGGEQGDWELQARSQADAARRLLRGVRDPYAH